jgi:hypothetical protein
MMRLGGVPAAYKASLWPTVAGSSTEAEFQRAYDGGRMSLYLRSILWDLNVPQDSSTVLYEDNDGATAMANAGKPTARSHHIDIKYNAIQEWVERNLVVLQRCIRCLWLLSAPTLQIRRNVGGYRYIRLMYDYRTYLSLSLCLE